jgi:nucleoside-diphosphate-sugar epimerase
VYAAVSEEPGLIAGWSDPARIEANAAMFVNLATPLAESGALAWVGLLQGTKAYGAHLHPIALPAREDALRDPHANFYFEQEDALRSLADRHGLGWTILRPQVVFGSAPGAAMNPVAAIGAYAALCREMGLPFAYPASGPLIWEAADADLIAAALLWAAREPGAQGQTFNLTNGDVFVLHDDWPALAEALDLEASTPRPGGIATLLESAEAQAAWRALAQRANLRQPDLAALIGQSHRYVDLLLSEQMIAKRALPTLVSTIKLRKAGFAACRDSLASLLHWLKRMEALRLLPSARGKGETDGFSHDRRTAEQLGPLGR